MRGPKGERGIVCSGEVGEVVVYVGAVSDVGCPVG